MAPFDLSGLGDVGSAALFIGIGVLFGFILESSGFGDSRKLAGQFYFTDLAVLKVMFTAIIVAVVLITWTSSVGLLNMDDVWVNTTFLWPGIVGGLVMGVGFVIGGYCPGTSLASLATLKLDGAMFVLGGLLGIFAFGETVGLFMPFFDSSELGRVTLDEAFGLSPGVVALLVVTLALVFFVGADFIQKKVHGPGPARRPLVGRLTGPALAAAILVLVTVPLVFFSAPTYADKWEGMTDKHVALAERQVQIDPGELLATISDDSVRLELLDLRSEPAFNRFHISGAKRANLEGLAQAREGLRKLPLNTVIVLVDTDEARSTEAYKLLVAMGVKNVYILEGGITGWLTAYAHKGADHGPMLALGDRHEASLPDAHHTAKRPYKKKIKLANKAKKSGGCG